MFIRIRTIKGRQYRYAEERWREGKKVRSRSTFLGAVASFIGAQFIRRHGMPDEDEMLERYNARCAKDAAERQAHLDKLHHKFGLRLGSNIPVPEEKSALNVLKQAETTATAIAAEESPADEGEAEGDEPSV